MVGACLAVGLGGCAGVRPAAVTAPDTLPSAAELDAQLAARHAALQSLRALARLRYEAPEESGTLREALIVARPDRLRVEVLSMLGSLFLVTASRGTLAAYAPREATVYRGAASPDNLERYARVALPVHQLIDLVLATPAPHPATRSEVSFDTVRGAVRLARMLADRQESVWFSSTGLPVAAEERGRDGYVNWEATFGGYQDHAGLAVATEITLAFPRWSRLLALALEGVEINPTLDNAVFTLQTPPGSTEIHLE